MSELAYAEVSQKLRVMAGWLQNGGPANALDAIRESSPEFPIDEITKRVERNTGWSFLVRCACGASCAKHRELRSLPGKVECSDCGKVFFVFLDLLHIVTPKEAGP